MITGGAGPRRDLLRYLGAGRHVGDCPVTGAWTSSKSRRAASGFGRSVRLPDVAHKRHTRSTAMRKIINSASVSLDGVTTDPGSWAIFDPDAAGEAGQA